MDIEQLKLILEAARDLGQETKWILILWLSASVAKSLLAFVFLLLVVKSVASTILKMREPKDLVGSYGRIAVDAVHRWYLYAPITPEIGRAYETIRGILKDHGVDKAD